MKSNGFSLDSLSNLERVMISDECFTLNYEYYGNSAFRISNCPNLGQLEIGNGSFKYFQLFKLSNLNSLQSIHFGNSCFKHVLEFVLDGLTSLESVKIGEYCFKMSDEKRDDGICRITNSPSLRQLEIGYQSFQNFYSLELSNLNSLQSIQFGEYCFKDVEKFWLKGE